MEPLRVLAIQTTPILSAEVKVLRSLLSHTVPQAPRRLDVLLAQGVDPGLEGGRAASEAFAGLHSVQLAELPVGALGQDRVGPLGRPGKILSLVRAVAEVPRIMQLASRYRPDIVYSSQQRWDQRLAVAVAKAVGAPRVVHLHYNVGTWLGTDALRGVRAADSVIAVSHFVRDEAIEAGVAPERAAVLYNSADPREIPTAEQLADRRRWLRQEIGATNASVVVGMVARLSPSKCQVELLDALIPLLQHLGDVHLVFAGAEFPAGNGVATTLRSAADRAGVARQVHLLGQRGDVPHLLDAFDIFAHPSLQEPCSLSVIEALAAGLPVVAWDDGGTAALVKDDCNGLLVKALDIHGLREAIRRLIVDERIRKRLATVARDDARTRFDPSRAAQRFVDLLADVRSASAT